MRINGQDVEGKLTKNITRIVLRSFVWIGQNKAETVSVPIKYRGGVFLYYYLKCRTRISLICVLAEEDGMYHIFMEFSVQCLF